MRTSFFAVCFTCFILLFSCDQKPHDLLPDLLRSDSAAVLFYKNPPDVRFFTLSKVKDMKQLKVITADVNGSVIAGKEACASWGKIYFYKGTEEVQVVYFSPEESCRTFSFIVNGRKHMVAMSPAAAALLENLKANSVELPSAAE